MYTEYLNAMGKTYAANLPFADEETSDRSVLKLQEEEENKK